MGQRFFSVKNFEMYQRYKDRLPPWIKLHYSLLEDMEWMRLDEVQQCRYMKLLLVASRCENRIPHDQLYLQNMLRVRGDVDLTPLFHSGFLVTYGAKKCQKRATTLKSDGPKVAPNGHAETETETETETDYIKSAREDARSTTKLGETKLGENIPPNSPTRHIVPIKTGKRPLREEDAPTDKHRAFAAQLKIDLGPEWGKFKNYCLAHDKRYANFEAAFRNWLAKAAEMKGTRHVL